MQSIDLTAKIKRLICFGLPLLILISAVIGYAEFKYWHRNEVIRLDDAKVTGTMVSVRVLTKGKVKELLFDDGAQVQAGDVIARLEVSITDEEIKQLENTVQLAKNRYAELQAGQTVKVAVQRERVVTPSPTYSTPTPSANLAKLEERANRMAELFEMGAVSAVERDKARRAYESALSESSSSQPQQSESRVEYYTEYVVEFRPTPPEVLAGAQQAIKQAELSLNVARQEARETEVVAPVSGTIYYGVESEKDLEAGDSVARIGDNRELWVEAVVTEDVFDKIPLGKLAEFTIDGKKVFGTVVEKIKPNITEATDEDNENVTTETLPEIPDATNQPAPLIGDGQPPAENSSPQTKTPTTEIPQPSTNEARQPAQAPTNDKNSASAENPTPPAENSSTPPPETSTTENPAPADQSQQQPTMPEIPTKPQEKPNDKFIIKISLPVDRDFDCKPGTVLAVEIKL